MRVCENSDLGVRHGIGLEQRQDPGEILRPTHAQGDDREMLGPHDAYRCAIDLCCLGVFNGRVGKAIDARNELDGPVPDANRLPSGS